MTRLLVTLLAASCLLPAASAQAPGSPHRVLAGVQVHPLWKGANARSELTHAAAAGARLVRVDVGWATLQPDGPDRWSRSALHRLDHVVGLARRLGLRPLLMVWSTPCWASTAPARLRQGCHGRWWRRGVARHPPRRPGDYAAALAALVRRYGDRVTAWEVWNEPNQRSFFRTGRPAADYARLLRAAYARVKAVAPRAVVLGGSIAEADPGFAERLYAGGARRSMDALAVHPYVGDRDPAALAGRIDAVRAVMRRHGDTRAVWLTELGWSTSTRRGGPGWANGVDEATQARYLTEAYARVRAWPYVRAALWYSLNDAGSDRADPADNYGLRRADGSPKPSLAAFEAVAAR